MKLNLGVDPKVDGGKWYELKKEKSKQRNSGSNVLPKDFTFPVEGWKIFPSRDIPVNFNYGHVYHYLVESITNILIPDHGQTDEERELSGIDCEDTVTAKPLRKGRWLLKSGFVENVHDNFNSEQGLYIIRGHVHHSMKSEYPLNVHVYISNASGYIKSSGCDCKASSLGRCAHVAAMLLMLSDFVTENGGMVHELSTSLPCTWNKGKKRKKNPNPLHMVTYKSSKRKNPSKLYNWDPRPKEYQKKVDIDQVSNFVKHLQSISQCRGLSMWETVLKITYEDFELDEQDIAYYKSLVENFEVSLLENNLLILKESVSCEIPGTEEQSSSPRWFQERWCRVTASACKSVVHMGEKLAPNNSKITLYNYIKNHLWYPEHVTTIDMQYGIENEPKAVEAYVLLTGVTVVKSGLWISRQYPHLAASPDGLIFDPEMTNLAGIIEIKCLKILRNKTVAEMIASNETNKSIMTRQCFTVDGGRLFLKKSHAYYFQVQLQLLVTEAEYCDFVLYAGIGEPHVERIFKDQELQNRIIKSSKDFWQKVFEMRFVIYTG